MPPNGNRINNTMDGQNAEAKWHNNTMENAKTKCQKNNVGTKTSDIRAGSNNTLF